MIAKDELLSKLRRYFSLNLYEVNLWMALLSRGTSTAGELSDIANVPRSRSYDVLESLEKKGFVITKLGKPIKYIAVDPSEVVDRVKKHMKLEAEQKLARLESVRNSDLQKELNLLFTQGIELVEPSDLAGSLKGRHNVYNHIESKLKNANKSVILVTTKEGFVRKAEGFKHIFERLNKKGVKIRIAAPLTKENKELIDELGSYAEIKALPKPVGRFCIVDGKDVIFMMLDDKDVHQAYDVGVWVNTPFFASALENMFDESWKSMKPAKF